MQSPIAACFCHPGQQYDLALLLHTFGLKKNRIDIIFTTIICQNNKVYWTLILVLIREIFLLKNLISNQCCILKKKRQNRPCLSIYH